MKEQLEKRKLELEAEFNKLSEELKDLSEKGAILNKRVSEIQAQRTALQGAYGEVMKMMPVDEPKLKEVKKSKSAPH